MCTEQPIVAIKQTGVALVIRGRLRHFEHHIIAQLFKWIRHWLNTELHAAPTAKIVIATRIVKIRTAHNSLDLSLSPLTLRILKTHRRYTEHVARADFLRVLLQWLAIVDELLVNLTAY